MLKTYEQIAKKERKGTRDQMYLLERASHEKDEAGRNTERLRLHVM